MILCILSLLVRAHYSRRWQNASVTETSVLWEGLAHIILLLRKCKYMKSLILIGIVIWEVCCCSLRRWECLFSRHVVAGSGGAIKDKLGEKVETCYLLSIYSERGPTCGHSRAWEYWFPWQIQVICD